MRLIAVLSALVFMAACAPDIPDDSVNCSTPQIDCEQIAKQMCASGYPAFCAGFNPDLLWCIRQLQSDDPSPEFWARCSRFFIADEEVDSTTMEIYAPNRY